MAQNGIHSWSQRGEIQMKLFTGNCCGAPDSSQNGPFQFQSSPGEKPKILVFHFKSWEPPVPKRGLLANCDRRIRSPGPRGCKRSKAVRPPQLWSAPDKVLDRFWSLDPLAPLGKQKIPLKGADHKAKANSSHIFIYLLEVHVQILAWDV